MTHLKRMKNPVLLALLLCLIAAGAFAQDPNADTDDRNSTVTAYVGSVFDNFIASEQHTYLNKNLAGVSGSTDERWLAGFNVDWRVLGSQGQPRQLWFYMETLHGVRSADVDCSSPDVNTRPVVCTGPDTDPTKLGAQARYILKNASSFEAFAGFRLEFAKPQKETSIYIKGQLGMMALAKNPGDAVDNHFIGMGLGVTAGRFSGSHFDAGWGRTDLYGKKRLDRWKYDGYLEIEVIKNHDWFRPFAQVTADTDFGGGADSIQTYLGINFDVGAILK